MPVRKIHLLCMSDNDEQCTKGLRLLARELGTDSVTHVRPENFEIIRAQLADKGIEERVVALAEDESEVYRELAAQALGAWGGDRALDVLLKLTRDNVNQVRATAIGALESWPESEAAYEVLLLAIDDAKWLIRMQAARALRTFPGQDADQALLDTLIDPNAGVRWLAEESLRQRDPTPVLPKLRDLLVQQTAAHMLDAAMGLLGEIGTLEDAKFLDKVGSIFNFSQPGQVRGWAKKAAKHIKVRHAGRP